MTPKNAYVYAALAMMAVFMLNWLSMAVFSYPIAYCLGKPIVAPFFNMWAGGLLSLLALVFVIGLFVASWRFCFNIAVIMMLIGGLPDFAHTIFSLGGVCHAQ